MKIPSYGYLVGLDTVARHDREGHPAAYLLGRMSKTGWWYYFPVAFAVKTPTAVLLLLLLSLLALIAGLRQGHRFHRLRDLRFDWYVLVIPMAVFYIFSMRSQINIGLRHILPVYPFLFVLVSAIVLGSPFRKALHVVLAALVLLQIAENVRIFPHYLAFFNFPSGGPAHGTDYLLDSNIDWGQDLKKLGLAGRSRQSAGLRPVFRHGLRRALPDPAEFASFDLGTRETSNLDCIGAISATILHDVYIQPGQFAWLRELKPIGNVGYSIYLYDLRKPRAR